MNMKINLKYFAAFMALASGLVSCVNPVEPYDAIYITEAQKELELTLSVDEPPASATFSVSSSVKATENVDVTLAVTPNVIEAWHRKGHISCLQRRLPLRPDTVFQTISRS